MPGGLPRPERPGAVSEPGFTDLLGEQGVSHRFCICLPWPGSLQHLPEMPKKQNRHATAEVDHPAHPHANTT